MRVDSRNAVVERKLPESLAAPRLQQWEYRSRLMDREADLTQWGAEGWELVTVVDAGGDRAMFYFRRRRNG